MRFYKLQTGFTHKTIFVEAPNADYILDELGHAHNWVLAGRIDAGMEHSLLDYVLPLELDKFRERLQEY